MNERMGNMNPPEEDISILEMLMPFTLPPQDQEDLSEESDEEGRVEG
jgi:hypothetical protein